MINRQAKRGLSWLLQKSGLSTRASGRVQALILMYHRVLPGGAPVDWPLKSLVVDSEDFAAQMDWLAARFEVCTAYEAITGCDIDNRLRVAVTFDDGYRDNYTHAVPILAQHHIRATFFVTSHFIGGTQRMWFDVAATMWRAEGKGEEVKTLKHWMNWLKRMPVADRDTELVRMTQPADWETTERDAAMSWQELAELQRLGHEIGCHSRSHPILTMLSEDQLRAEVVGAVEDLRQRGLEPLGIAYPNGDSNDQVVAMAREAGLQYGVTTRGGWHKTGFDRFEVCRVDVNPARVRRWSDDAGDGLATEIAWRRLRGVHT